MVGAKDRRGILDATNGQEAVGLHSLVAADPHQPSPEPLLVNLDSGHEVQEVGVVVAPDQPRPRPPGEGVADEIHRFPAARASVDDVAEEQHARFSVGRLCVLGDGGKKCLEEVGTAVNVADGVGDVRQAGSFSATNSISVSAAVRPHGHTCDLVSMMSDAVEI